MEKYTIYCTEEQIKKALELGVPIQVVNSILSNSIKTVLVSNGFAIIPTAEQMIGFLRSKGMKFYFNDITTLWQIVYNTKIIGQGCSDNKELATIDSALEYLSKNK